MIADPFPSVWHTMKDNASALDYPTIDYINKAHTKLNFTIYLLLREEVFFKFSPTNARKLWINKFR